MYIKKHNTIISILVAILITMFIFVNNVNAKSHSDDADIENIKQFLKSFYDSIKKSNNLKFDDFYVTDYGLHNGMTREQIISTDLERVGIGVNIVAENNKRIDIDMIELLNIADVNILNKYIKNGRMIFDIEISLRQLDGEIHKINRSITKENDKWKFIGNSKLFDVSIDPEARRWVTPYSITMATGVGIYIDQSYDSDLWTFIVKGDGLPEEGIKLIRKNNGENNEEISIILDNNYINSPGLLSGRWNFYALTDEAIQKISDSSVYTVYAYNSKDVLSDIQTVKIRKRPLKISEISNDNDFSLLKFNNKYKDFLVGNNKKINVTLQSPKSHISSFVYLALSLVSRNSVSRIYMLMLPSSPSQQMEIEILRDAPRLADIAIFDVSTYRKGIFYITSYVFTDQIINGNKEHRSN